MRRNGDRVDIEVIDNGAGLPKHNRNRLLEPYVTTKGNKGTGLGLAIVQKSVEQHGGDAVARGRAAGARPHARRPDPHHAAGRASRRRSSIAPTTCNRRRQRRRMIANERRSDRWHQTS